MAADVSSLVRVMKDDGDGKGKRDLITRDLLGGCDLGSQVPAAWDRRVDLLTGRAYLEREESDPERLQLHDLNLPPPAAPAALPEDSTALELRLPAAAPSGYQSVCTLEKVRTALERAERETRGRRSGVVVGEASASPSSSSTSSSAAAKRRLGAAEEGMDGLDSSVGSGMMAAGCPGCLFYVLISRRNPKCPRCDSHVPIPVVPKKPRIDLNSVSL